MESSVLIIDRQGYLGREIYEGLKETQYTILVSGKLPQSTKNLLFLSFKKNIPEIPNGLYSQIFFIWDGQ